MGIWPPGELDGEAETEKEFGRIAVVESGYGFVLGLRWQEESVPRLRRLKKVRLLIPKFFDLSPLPQYKQPAIPTQTTLQVVHLDSHDRESLFYYLYSNRDFHQT